MDSFSKASNPFRPLGWNAHSHRDPNSMAESYTGSGATTPTMGGMFTPTTTAAASEAGDIQSTPATHWNCESCYCPPTNRFHGPRGPLNDSQLNAIVHARKWESIRVATKDHEPRSPTDQAKMDSEADTVLGSVERMEGLSYHDYLFFNGDGVEPLTRAAGAESLASWVRWGGGVPDTAATALKNATLPDGISPRTGLESLTQMMAAADPDEMSKAAAKEQKARVFKYGGSNQ
jgi:hypothetical protein